jgi:hypothetical protein
MKGKAIIVDINDILNSLGLDLTNPEVRRGAAEAINAILQSRQPTMSMDALGGDGAMGGNEIDLELDPDLIQPSQKHSSSGNNDDIEVDDEEDLLNQIKHNDSEDTLDTADAEDGQVDNNSSSSQKGADATDSSENTGVSDDDAQGEQNSGDADNTDESGNTGDDTDGVSQAQETETEDSESSSNQLDDSAEEESASESGNDDSAQDGLDTSDDSTGDDELDVEDESEFNDDLVDDELKGVYDDEGITAKQNARKIKRERTIAAAKKALADAQSRKVSATLIKELESAIAALEELTEAVKKNINDLSDDEFNRLINRVFDAIDAVGDTSLTFSSDEERQIKASEIKADLASNKTQTELSAEDIEKIRNETQAVKARDKETAKYQRRSSSSFKGFQDFLTSLYRAIALQVSSEESNDDSWSAINRRYGGTGVLQPGKKLNELPNKRIPVIDFYFDQSGSWTANDIKVGKKAVEALADMEAKGQIKINLYYFGNYVSTSPNQVGNGTSGWNEIVKNVIATRATNVIVMTDDDMEDWWSPADKPPLTYTVPGYVWYLWKNGANAPRLPRDLKGRGGTQQFSFTHNDV